MPISAAHKGASFVSHIKQKLLRAGFTVAIPEPDIGDDLWAVGCESSAAPAANNTKKKNRSTKLWRFQVKGVFSGDARALDEYRYKVRLTASWLKRLNDEFYYVIGVWDARESVREFRWACLPNVFFSQLHEEKRIRSSKSGSTTLSFYLNWSQSYPMYSMDLRYEVPEGRKRVSGPRADVTEFFSWSCLSFEEILDRCRKWNGSVKLSPIKPRNQRKGKGNAIGR